MAKKVDAIQCWTTLEPGILILQPGCAADFKTGDWRTGEIPQTDYEKCTKCGRCYILCPDLSYVQREDGMYDWLADYCKGCGICAAECPVNAITMVKEK